MTFRKGYTRDETEIRLFIYFESCLLSMSKYAEGEHSNVLRAEQYTTGAKQSNTN